MIGNDLSSKARCLPPCVAALLIAWLGLSATTALHAMEVAFSAPDGMSVVFGNVEVIAEVYDLPVDDSVTQLMLRVDGEPRGSLTRPPWRFVIDVGHDNVEHRFELHATSRNGLEAHSRVKTPALRIDDEVAVQLQQLYVTATTDEQRVLDLDRSTFRIRDDGKTQQLITFARGDIAITATLAIDASKSMRGERLASALEGAKFFAQGLKQRDEASLLLFSDQLLRVTPFSGDAEQVMAGLSDVEADGNTAINDHLFLSLQLLDNRQGRRVVILFTDGADLHSVLSMDQVLWKARRSQALIYWLRLEDRGGSSGYTSFSTAWRDAEGSQHEFERLEAAVDQSGGRIVTVTDVSAINSAFADILTELREQYVLGYYPTDNTGDGAWHKVDVRSSRPGVKLRSRKGYVDF